MLAAAAVAVAAVAAPDAGAARPTSAVRIAFPAADGTLTPYTFELGYPLMTLVYDTLTWRGPDGVARPWLARSVDTAPGGRRVVVRLRPARWHDGRPLTAADVAFTFRYVAAHPHPRFSPQLEAVERVEATDRSTVVFRLRHPSRGFLDQPLGDVPILPAHIWRHVPAGESAPAGRPVGSGPYRLVSYDASAGYRFRSNRRYFRGRPLVDRISVPIERDFDRAIRALERRRLDMVPAAPPGLAAEGLEREPLRVARGPSYLGTMLLLNVREPPFDRPEVRRAVAAAVDVERVAEAAGDAVPADRGFLHPASRWAVDSPAPRLDPAGSRTALAGLGAVRVLVPRGDPARVAAAGAVVSSLRGAGVDVRAAPVSQARLDLAVREPPDFQAAIASSPALASFDPDFLRAEFAGGAPLNRSGYASAEWDTLAARTASAPDAAARRAALSDELRVLARDAPAVPLYFANGAFPYRPRAYDGWVYVKGTGILDKQSFLPPPAERRARGDGAEAGAGSAASGGGIGPLGIAALVLGGGALLAAGAALLARRR